MWVEVCGQMISASPELCKQVLPNGIKETLKYLSEIDKLCREKMTNIHFGSCKQALQESFVTACTHKTEVNSEDSEEELEQEEELELEPEVNRQEAEQE